MKKIILAFVLALTATGLFSQAVAQEVPEGAPREILIQTPGLMFNPVRFKVQPGETVKITLENIDEMSHNLVITRPGAREVVVLMAFLLLKEEDQQGFVPDTNLVLAHTPLLHPGEKKSILFQAPEEEGVYPYVCTFPGHGSIMYGAIHVTRGEMPPLEEDGDIPPQHDNTKHAHTPGSKLPVMYRTFMPDCGPAGIAVGMKGNVSYCWDAGECRLRYAWKGGFISLESNWASNGSKKAALLGNIFYQEGPTFPLRLGTKAHVPDPEFLGYSMENGYPTFRYRLKDVEVSERITPLEGTPGFKREFVFSAMQQPLWFFGDAERVSVKQGPGEWDGDHYRVPAADGETTLTLIVKDNEL